MRTFIAIAAALAASPAIASAPNATEFELNVQHEDLDLSTQKGVSVLDARIQTLIKRQCANGGRDSASIRLERQCRESALASAESQVRVAAAQAKADKVRLASTEQVAPGA